VKELIKEDDGKDGRTRGRGDRERGGRRTEVILEEDMEGKWKWKCVARIRVD
jgi:hypothetical protein